MRSLDVFVLSSIYEGFGLVLLEAMEASLPVVASRVSAIPEIVVEGETGYLVPPRDPEALSAAMNRTLDFGVRQQMGRAGHARLLDQFAVDQMADKTLAIYERVLDRGASTKQTSSR
jgi:glycosyltransferase involved in cell wall biosynthesis